MEWCAKTLDFSHYLLSVYSKQPLDDSVYQSAIWPHEFKKSCITQIVKGNDRHSRGQPSHYCYSFASLELLVALLFIQIVPANTIEDKTECVTGGHWVIKVSKSPRLVLMSACLSLISCSSSFCCIGCHVDLGCSPINPKTDIKCIFLFYPILWLIGKYLQKFQLYFIMLIANVSMLTQNQDGERNKHYSCRATVCKLAYRRTEWSPSKVLRWPIRYMHVCFPGWLFCNVITVCHGVTWYMKNGAAVTNYVC